MRVHLHMSERGDAALVMAALAHFLPVIGNFEQKIKVVAGVIAAFLKRRHDGLDRRMAVAERKRGGSGIRDSSASLGGLDDVHRSHAAHVMAMNVHRKADFGIESLDQALGAIRREHTRHVLDGDGICAKIFELLTVL